MIGPVALGGVRGQVLLWVGILLGCFLAGGVVLYVVRRYARGGGVAAGPSLTMDQVRQMRERGEISDREYERLRRIVASRHMAQRGSGPAV